MSGTFATGPEAPFIAIYRVSNDKGKRVLAVGRTRGGSALLQVTARAGDFRATGTREAAKAAARKDAP
jgi:hypothetical protein